MSVYFVQRPVDGLVKIGFSDNVAKRIAALKCSYRELKVLRVADGDRKSEAAMHKMFEANRVRGEWFSFDHKMLDCPLPTLSAQHPLAAWAKSKGLFHNFLARQAGISPRSLAAYLNDGATPLVVRNSFEVVTGGDVRAVDWPEAK